MSLINKLMKGSKLEGQAVASKSRLLESKNLVDTGVPAINIAFSGTADGGFGSGFTMIAGPSKHFKSNIMLLLASAYLKKYDDAVIVFYDSEFGSTKGYFESFGIDLSRVVHKPILNMEEFKFDVVQMLENIELGDHVFIMIDSIGNLASVKEINDAIDGKSVADMTRAKQLKSVFRMITPHLTIKDIPLVGVNHTYDEIGGMGVARKIVSGGTGAQYSANTTFIVGRRQIKDGRDVTGYTFVLNVEKSRYVREKSAIPFDVTFNGGIAQYSGLLEIARATGHVNCPKMGWYTRSGVEDDKNWRKKDTDNAGFWEPILSDSTFTDAVDAMYGLSTTTNGGLFVETLNSLIDGDGDEVEFDPETGEILDQLDEGGITHFK